mmetsp:Transcript_17469/g.28693  ORF Transcript_17469/g.28693 Transcript_17469/m.28693 type:complete len:664 (+) Transcript_17469:268-2259(+)|eukprot:CAMPEP_0184351842 /NCGR_PEP_ID=MMETSP1089-20130417/54988_1 /TAXON_ID=38269 ORGANISM="Gloeochaete wittrockiana, Strain SAG46.84" /NCGR_SAMPLE_ID=MMETSP1089 /ASSEMBLY_ACC=CAM_ASM_000445 /LENGTH=663 /DNA_ID=CAMNT_0026685645 /DNA_START=206 /DNA_END=2197 /DNA_ORIENTATION=+
MESVGNSPHHEYFWEAMSFDETPKAEDLKEPGFSIDFKSILAAYTESLPKSIGTPPYDLSLPTQSVPGDKKDRVRRPMNAYILFSNAYRTTVATAHPTLDNASISSVLGQLWNSFSADERQPFVNASNTMRQQFKLDHPDFKYVGKKPSRAPAKQPHSNTSASVSRKDFLSEQDARRLRAVCLGTVPVDEPHLALVSSSLGRTGAVLVPSPPQSLVVLSPPIESTERPKKHRRRHSVPTSSGESVIGPTNPHITLETRDHIVHPVSHDSSAYQFRRDAGYHPTTIQESTRSPITSSFSDGKDNTMFFSNWEQDLNNSLAAERVLVSPPSSVDSFGRPLRRPRQSISISSDVRPGVQTQNHYLNEIQYHPLSQKTMQPLFASAKNADENFVVSSSAERAEPHSFASSGRVHSYVPSVLATSRGFVMDDRSDHGGVFPVRFAQHDLLAPSVHPPATMVSTGPHSEQQHSVASPTTAHVVSPGSSSVYMFRSSSAIAATPCTENATCYSLSSSPGAQQQQQPISPARMLIGEGTYYAAPLYTSGVPSESHFRQQPKSAVSGHMFLGDHPSIPTYPSMSTITSTSMQSAQPQSPDEMSMPSTEPQENPSYFFLPPVRSLYEPAVNSASPSWNGTPTLRCQPEYPAVTPTPSVDAIKQFYLPTSALAV